MFLPLCSSAPQPLGFDVFTDPGPRTIEGYRAPFPNLLLMLTGARSWIAQGMDAADFDTAMADLRLAAALAPEPMRERARTLLDKLAADRDPVVSATARWCVATPVTEGEVKELREEM